MRAYAPQGNGMYNPRGMNASGPSAFRSLSGAPVGGRRRSITESTETYQTPYGPRTDLVTQEVFTERQGNLDVTRTITRRSSLDYGQPASVPTVYSTMGGGQSWARYSKPDLSMDGGTGNYNTWGARASSLRRSGVNYESAQPDPSMDGGAGNYNTWGSRAGSLRRSGMFTSQQSLGPDGRDSSRQQPIKVSCYTSSRQRNRITAPRNPPQYDTGAPPPAATQYRRSSVMSMGSRRSSVTSLDISRPLQVSSNTWNPSNNDKQAARENLREALPVFKPLPTNDSIMSPSSIGSAYRPPSVAPPPPPPPPPASNWQVGVYSKDIFPTADQVKKVAQLVSASLYDPRNANTKGGRMFRKRQERAAQYTLEGYGRNEAPIREFPENWNTLDDLQERAKEHKIEKVAKDMINHGIPLPPDPEELLRRADAAKKRGVGTPSTFTVFDPSSGQTRTIQATNFDIDLSDEERCEHNIVTPTVCSNFVRDLRSGRGKGSAMFQRRMQKSLKWVTDETNRREKSFGVIEAIKSGSITEGSLQRAVDIMQQNKPRRLPSMNTVFKQMTPWEAAEQGVPLESAGYQSKADMVQEVVNTAADEAEMAAARRNQQAALAAAAAQSRIGRRGLAGGSNASLASAPGVMNLQMYNPSSSQAPTPTPTGPPRGGFAMPGMTGGGPVALPSMTGGGGFNRPKAGGFRAASTEPRQWKPVSFNRPGSSMSGYNTPQLVYASGDAGEDL